MNGWKKALRMKVDCLFDRKLKLRNFEELRNGASKLLSLFVEIM